MNSLNCFLDPDYEKCQPGAEYVYPVTAIGKRNRRFSAKYLTDFKWVHYDKARDRVFCDICITAMKRG